MDMVYFPKRRLDGLSNWHVYTVEGVKFLYIEPELADVHRYWLIQNPPHWLVPLYAEIAMPRNKATRFLADLTLASAHEGALKLIRIETCPEIVDRLIDRNFKEFTLVTPQLLGWIVEDFFVLDAVEDSIFLV